MLLPRFCVGFLLALMAGCGDDDRDREQPQTAPAAPAPQVRETADPTVVPDRDPGKVIYVHYCGDCHDAGPGHPGTMRLAARFGADKSVLTARTDIPPAYVTAVVRNGLQMMPPFRPSEISDEALEILVAYVAANFQDEVEGAQ